MNMFNSPESSSLDGVRVITCEKPRVGWNRGLTPSDQHRASISAALRGRKKARIHSAETRAKMSAAKTGRIQSAETRAKISAAKGARYLGLSMAEWGEVFNQPKDRIIYQLKTYGHLDYVGQKQKPGHKPGMKGEIMTPWGKFNSPGMAKDCLAMLGIPNPYSKIAVGLRTDPENYYYIKEAK